jgi:hypothetical protein
LFALLAAAAAAAARTPKYFCGFFFRTSNTSSERNVIRYFQPIIEQCWVLSDEPDERVCRVGLIAVFNNGCREKMENFPKTCLLLMSISDKQRWLAKSKWKMNIRQSGFTLLMSEANWVFSVFPLISGWFLCFSFFFFEK